jgi:7,8-dihydropterin-6-yl-methyl-4-(beta-D-ribofuranosyl)aminobenzene 5'-phosphate synthase
LILLAPTRFTAATERVSSEQQQDISITILYDNYVFTEGLRSDWGFSCILKGTEKTILFDTGTKGKLLLENIEKLKVDPEDVELVVISHNHRDHTGGLLAFLSKNSNVVVYLPPSCPGGFVQKVKGTGAKVVTTDSPVQICKGVHLTGPMGTDIIEQAMIVDTREGSVVVTGCSHPGIVRIVERAKVILSKEIYLVFGGFHLLHTPEVELKQTIKEFQTLGVINVGPTHCTGDRAIKMFERAYGSHFLQMGVGRTLEFEVVKQ